MIHSNDDLSKVLNFLTEKVARLMKVDACSLYLYNPKTDELTLKATYGLNRDLIDKIIFRSGTGLTGNTLKLLKPISIADARRSSEYIEITELGEQEYASFLSVPLVYNGDPIGVLSVQNKISKKFKKQDIDFLLTLSIPAVGLIEKAKFMGAVGSFDAPQSIAEDVQQPSVKIEYLKDHFIKAIPAVPGIAMGYLKIITDSLDPVVETQTEVNFGEQAELLKKAFTRVSEEIRNTKKVAENKFGPDEASIFEAYLLFLESANFQQQIIAEIHSGLSALKALEKVVGKYMDRMSNADDEYLKERAYDIQDVGRKISDFLVHGESLKRNQFACEKDTIFLKEFWSISDFVEFDSKKTKAVISSNGSASSHIAILADTLNLPSVLGMGNASQNLKDGDFLIVDGFSGTIIVNPSQSTIDTFKKEIKQIEQRSSVYDKYRNKKIIYTSGTAKRQVFIGANLGMIAHIESAKNSGADSVGLYRTEFPFLVRKSLPTEEEQFANYKRTIELMKGLDVVFRTLDIGGDKEISYLNLPKESNPALGWRAIRFSLERKDLFRIQLRALLRASYYGRISLMLPMITSVEEVLQAKDIIDSVKKELRDENIKFSKNIPLGIMIEVPSAVEIADNLAKHVDFFSIGTNDLIQYTLAADRTNPLVAEIYTSLHPAILRQIHRTVTAAHKANIPVGVCGDMASQPMTAAILLGLKVDSLSMIPRAIPAIKHLASSCSEHDFTLLAKRCLSKDTSAKIKLELEAFFFSKKIIP